MKYFMKMMLIIGLVVASQLGIAGEITDSFADGDTLTAESLNNAKDAINDNDARITAVEAAYQIGDIGPAGGWVFYVDAEGRHGLEAAPTEQNPDIDIRWDNGVAGVDTEANGDGLGAGEMNTMLVIASQGTDSATYAAGICANLVITSAGVDYGDWYLPSKYELNLMHSEIGPGAPSPGNVGGFAESFYWSSSEIDADTAWARDFGTLGGGALTRTKTATPTFVRAIRSF
jgi:hypothetical protein